MGVHACKELVCSTDIYDLSQVCVLMVHHVSFSPESHRKEIMSVKNGRVVTSLISLMESESEKVSSSL